MMFMGNKVNRPPKGAQVHILGFFKNHQKLLQTEFHQKGVTHTRRMSHDEAVLNESCSYASREMHTKGKQSSGLIYIHNAHCLPPS